MSKLIKSHNEHYVTTKMPKWKELHNIIYNIISPLCKKIYILYIGKKNKPLKAKRPITIASKITEGFVFINFLICKLYNKPLLQQEN